MANDFPFLIIGMNSFVDPYPDLERYIDIGGDRYNVTSNSRIELGYKGRADFIKAFPVNKGKNAPTLPAEYLLRKHLYYDANPKKRTFHFDLPGEKEALIAVLEERARRLLASNEFSSSVLKNTVLTRAYNGIQDILQHLKGAVINNEANESKESKSKKSVQPVDEDKLLQFILQLAWFMLHPDKAPKALQEEWTSMMKEMETLRLGDIASQIRKFRENKGLPVARPLNYFQKMNLGAIVKQPTIQNALDEAKKMAMGIDDTVSKEDMAKRLKALLHVLQTKKYLNSTFQFDESRLNVIDTSTLPSLQTKLMTNPIHDDKSKKLDRPLGVAMKPLFDYFDVMFDPVYGFVRSVVLSYLHKNDSITGKNLIPHLLTLLHVCRHLSPTEGGESGSATYGVYELANVDDETLSFVQMLLGETRMKVNQLNTDKTAKNAFQSQLTSLPNVQLSMAIPKGFFGGDDDTLKKPAYISFYIVDENLTVPTLQSYLKTGVFTASLHEEVGSFFQPRRLYMTYSNDAKDVPVRFQRIDMSQVSMDSTDIPVTQVPFANKDHETLITSKHYHLDDLVDMDPYVICTLAEITMSVWIAFQERMPK
jgi:hypothetical protein